ncbi:ser-thr gpi-anchored family [Fusarium heterosporum]|uniref:Ser-thr gpi-anchored family n=1 Tax=Fusarium heterosporum TaxID=42747 RepID=A0A8H5TIR0_FUSHE|nr:ser-thr gpi-anchored family [Fusarium heterosporum]
MQFTISAAALMAFAAQALAQVADFDPVLTPTNWQEVSTGKTLEITWQAKPKYSGEKISISLIGGATQNTQVPIKTIATGVDNDAASYSWTIDSSVGTNNVYGLVLKLESNPEVFQYSFPFKIEGGKEEAKPTEAKPTETKADYELPSAPATTKVPVHYPGPETTVIAVHETVTVPCNTTAGSPTTFVPVVKTHYPVPAPPAPAPPAHGNGTAPHVPEAPVYTAPAQPPVVPTHAAGQPPVAGQATPTPVPVSGAARFGAPIAVVAGLVMAAFAL